MVLKSISHRIPPSIVDEKQEHERLYWQQCQRIYTFQPIYRVTGSLMAIELLTAVFTRPRRARGFHRKSILRRWIFHNASRSSASS